jgi:hypothetical protein
VVANRQLKLSPETMATPGPRSSETMQVVRQGRLLDEMCLLDARCLLVAAPVRQLVAGALSEVVEEFVQVSVGLVL